MLAKDLSTKEMSELNKLLIETEGKLVKLRADILTGKSTELGKIRTLRKDYARIRTVLNQKGK